MSPHSRCVIKSRVVVSLLVVAFLTLSLPPSRACADEMREFVMSCSYGVLAGTLVGAASLAFSDRPGDNLNKIARGASIGLYAGILLGLYVVYGVSAEGGEEAPTAEELTSLGDVRLPLTWPKRPTVSLSLAGKTVGSFAGNFTGKTVMVMPIVSERGLVGAAAQLSILSF